MYLNQSRNNRIYMFLRNHQLRKNLQNDRKHGRHRTGRLGVVVVVLLLLAIHQGEKFQRNGGKMIFRRHRVRKIRIPAVVVVILEVQVSINFCECQIMHFTAT